MPEVSTGTRALASMYGYFMLPSVSKDGGLLEVMLSRGESKQAVQQEGTSVLHPS